MNDTDRLIAAVFTASIMPKKATPADYFKMYDTFIEVIKDRETSRTQKEVDAWTGQNPS
jgi:hypothetical protein